ARVLRGYIHPLGRERRGIAGFEVVPTVMREAWVEHRLVREERLRTADVDDRRAELLQRADDLLALFDRPRIAADDRYHRLAVELLGNEGQRRGLPGGDERHQLPP